MDKLKLFVIWLNGYMEACGNQLNEEQTQVVKTKLDSLFEHEAGQEVKPVAIEFEHTFPSIYDTPNDPDGPTIYRC